MNSVGIEHSFHLVGIGGIGMSGLAQLLKHAGCEVSGSDRDYDRGVNSDIFNSLKAQGIELFPQDGSFMTASPPSAIIYSTAIEPENPDFKVSEEIPRIHRAEALSLAVRGTKKHDISVGITGTCGKTTVTAWISETLFNLGLDPAMLCGGLVNRFASTNYAGNFRSGNGKYFIFEADESDKSLLHYSPDYSVILNAGTDHYSRDELIEVFSSFLKRTKKGAVIAEECAKDLKHECYRHLEIRVVSDKPSGSSMPELENIPTWRLKKYSVGKGVPSAIFATPEGREFQMNLPVPGRHNAMNALANFAFLDLLGFKSEELVEAVSDFKGAWRRFDFAGRNSHGTAVYDDYAHNVDKIVSCLKTAKELCTGTVYAVFQPHGYGPLKFMRKELFSALEKNAGNCVFIFLPVFYAGGTSSFEPKSEAVAKEYSMNGVGRYLYFDGRDRVESFLMKNAGSDDFIVVMGARDNTLSAWARHICSLS